MNKISLFLIKRQARKFNISYRKREKLQSFFFFCLSHKFKIKQFFYSQLLRSPLATRTHHKIKNKNKKKNEEKESDFFVVVVALFTGCCKAFPLAKSFTYPNLQCFHLKSFDGGFN
jgi:hypothetical protein